MSTKPDNVVVLRTSGPMVIEFDSERFFDVHAALQALGLELRNTGHVNRFRLVPKKDNKPCKS